MRVAKELPDQGYVNLGIGIPTLVSNFVPDGKVVFYHSESGVLNCGPLAEEGEEDIDLINAGGQFLQMVPGMSFFNSAEAFAMIRGGHVDVTVLGSHQVAANGDLANWMLPQRGVGNVGGAMDLAAGAKDVIVAMEHTDRQDRPKILEEVYVAGDWEGLRVVDSDRPGGDQVHGRRLGLGRGRAGMDAGGSPGTDRARA